MSNEFRPTKPHWKLCIKRRGQENHTDKWQTVAGGWNDERGGIRLRASYGTLITIDTNTHMAQLFPQADGGQPTGAPRPAFEAVPAPKIAANPTPDADYQAFLAWKQAQQVATPASTPPPNHEGDPNSPENW